MRKNVPDIFQKYSYTYKIRLRVKLIRYLRDFKRVLHYKKRYATDLEAVAIKITFTSNDLHSREERNN